MADKISSGLRTLFLVHFIIGIVFGLIFLLIPVVYGNVVNWEVQDPGAFRLIGAAMLSFSVTSLLCYRNPVWDKVKITVVMEIVWPALGTLATVWALLFEGFPPIAWLNVVLLALFFIFFVIFYSRENR